MKKFITLIAAIVMIATMLTGCGVDAPTADDMFKKYDTETSVSADTDKKETADNKKDEKSDDKDADKKDETKSDTADKKEVADKTADKNTSNSNASNTNASKNSGSNASTGNDSNASQSVTTQEAKATEPAKTAEPAKPAHTHSYTATVTANPTCESAGVKTYTCSCGDSYTESIPALGHAWQTKTQTIQTGQVWVAKTVNCIVCNGCGATFATNEEFDMHGFEMSMNGDENHHSCGVGAVESGGHYEPTYGEQSYQQCSRCGATK